jgi:glycosyltransferase involved in cell wall biosynthesis
VKIAFLLLTVDGMGGTERSVVSQANALASAGHKVTIISIIRRGDVPHFAIDPGVRVDYLVDLADPEVPRAIRRHVADDAEAYRLHNSPSLLVPRRWDGQFSALTDAGCHDYLADVDSDVLVTVTPGLLAIATQLLPEGPALIHQEHRSSSDRTSGLEPLLTFAPRADVLAVLTPSMAEWLAGELGSLTPTLEVVPNPLPKGYKPRSTLDTKLIVAAGRLVMEKQFPKLIEAFGQIADQIPDWRLRIVGSGGAMLELIRWIRKTGLYDRVELPGQSANMPTEWAKASISALTSRSEGLPLVVQEAMAAGVPVAAFDCPSGVREVIQHERNGLLVAPDSIEGMAGALLRLATDDDLRHRLGQGAIESSTRYAPEVLVERWVQIFQAAVERRHGRRERLVRRVAELPDRPRREPFEMKPVPGLTPALARARGLQWAVDTARRVCDTWFVLPPQEALTPVVVVPMSDRARFLTELGREGAPQELSLLDTAGHGWPTRRGHLTELAPSLAAYRTPRVSVEPWPTWEGTPTILSQGCRVDVEFWEAAPDGTLVSEDKNAYATAVPPDTELVDFEIEGVAVQTLPLMAMPTVKDANFPIDVVYTWVDGEDPEWDAQRAERLAGLTGTARTKESSGAARFVSRDELRYSMRSIHLFAPWVRTIHLVTAGQVPKWLDDHPQIRVVDHAEIMPADALPTFNSHAIESCIHKIPDLAEHFIYFNDDFLLARPLSPRMFFKPGGQPSVFLSRTSLGLDNVPGSPPWQKAGQNNRKLLAETFGVAITHSLLHAPYAHRRSVLAEIEARFPEQVARTARSPFRSDTDVSMLSSLAQHYGLVTGSAVSAEGESVFINISKGSVVKRLRMLMSRDQDFICLGDHHHHALKPAVLTEVLTNFFESYFPEPAPWERQG